MTDRYFNGPRVAPRRFWDFVVPADTAGAVAQRNPLDAVSVMVDTVLVPEFNQLFPGMSMRRQATKQRRAIFGVLRTSSAIATAPAEVQALATTLETLSPQAFGKFCTLGGDCWLIGNSADAIRHAGYDLLRDLGVEYLNPHPYWRSVTPRGTWELEFNEVKNPAYGAFAYAGNGGFGSSVNPVVPNRALATQHWETWFSQKRMPIGVNGYGDGDESYVTDRQDELRHDHTMLAWVSSVAKRGYSATGDFPTAPFNGDGTLGKLCCTHHGSSGSYPAPPAGPSPWLGVVYRIENATTFAPGGPLSADPGPDTGANPSTSYTAFGGGIALHADHHYQRACNRLQTYGYPHVETQYVSSEPPDGDNKCECDRCVDLLRNGPYATYLTALQQTQDSSFADRVWHMANEDQKYLQNQFTNAKIPGTTTPFCPGTGVLAYTTHAAVPSIPIHQNSIAVVLPQSSESANLRPSEFIASWIAKRASNAWGQFRLGITPQFLLDSTSLGGLYWPNPAEAAALNKSWIDGGFSLLSAQTGFSGLSSGILWWLLAQQVWEPALVISERIDRWFELAFGPAKAPIRALYNRAWQWWERTQDEIGRMAADTDAAVVALAAAPDPAGVDGRVAIRNRLDHVRAWVHAQRLLLDWYDAEQFTVDGQLDAFGTSPPAVYLYGTRSTPAVIRIEVEVGATTFKYTKNADHPTPTYVTGVTLPVAGGTFAVPGTTFTVSFPAGTYLAAQYWTQAPSYARLVAAEDALESWCWRILQHNTLHSSRIADKVLFGAYHPVSSASEGSSPPAVTVASFIAATYPTVGTAYVDVEIDSVAGGTARGQATFLWKRNGVTVTTGVATAASNTLTSAGVVVQFPVGTYAVGQKWHFTVNPNIEKWQTENAAASANWPTIVEPTRAEIDAAITADVAAYVPVAGVSRRTFTDTYQSFNVSALTTMRATPQSDGPSMFVLKTPANPTTIKVWLSGKGAASGVPLRVLLKDRLTGATLQSASITTPASGPPTSYDFVITQPAGTYKLLVATTQYSTIYAWIEAPQNCGCVWISDEFDAPMVVQNGFPRAAKQYFYVPAGETKIVMAFNAIGATGVADSHLIQFYDPSGVAVTTARVGLSQWQCAVAGGLDNAAWSFTGLYSRDNSRQPRFVNCPNRIAPSPYQLLIP